jgi:Fe-S cluster assembly protein SufD
LDNKELFDLHTTIEHAMPGGRTREIVRGIVGGAGKAVFNGRIHIHPHAQKTDARLSNNNLLLSKQAEVDFKPELEIYADDVRCAHGATVSQIEEWSLYYLQSRGIDKKQAQAMLTFGFINELLEQMPHPEVGDWLRPKIRQRFDMAFSDSI